MNDNLKLFLSIAAPAVINAALAAALGLGGVAIAVLVFGNAFASFGVRKILG